MSLVIVLKGGELTVVCCPHDIDFAIAATKGLERTVLDEMKSMQKIKTDMNIYEKI